VYFVSAVDGSGQRSSNETLPENDIAWNSFVQQYVYWPQKLVLTSFDAPENSTDPAKLYFTPTSSGQARVGCSHSDGVNHDSHPI
jgi:hypothetical protein